ncbi:PREDICTED: juvenile hormone epoxide hydrolase-like [Papilio polytes]|uniref:juvenile hormone epoxide hydrolase-like n=1 Tax=Papilio polytes TaxID=76194 RepID=UPI00067646A5|nr:PREDICTED: juvenile hormone epoxide hydrolase-like [Papilio polytes]XP_013138407.1 PREDICTED: juvenile hormone epoxide hydrolase-like [Papilio polytes]XP_013138408.1 PREDICTED: juvenile hormone epoxide hydrolase-like [Papilio polytes]
MSKVLFGLLAVVAAYICWSIFSTGSSQPPRLDPEEWWGPKELKGKQDTSIRPYQVKFTDEMIKDLRHRLKNHRPLVPPLEGIAFQYGFNSKAIEPWLKYWAEEYPFKEREAFLNKYPHFKTNIQGLDIHFIRVKPQVPAGVEVVPLLLMHGWPGSVREFYEAIPLLTKQQPDYNFAFEVIVPSLPGYGFSDAPVRPGVAPGQIAVIFKNLMNRLGFKKFYIQGGDWGSAIASALATLYPNEILGHHTNFPMVQNKQAVYKTILGSFFPSLVVESHLASRMYPLSSLFSYLLEETGYAHIQGTKPDTVGVGLTDSPSGLLAYILEKFSTWTNVEHKLKPDGGLEFRFTKDKLIDNLMIYWTSNCITTSMRIYSEEMSIKNRQLDLNSYITPVPTWAFQTKSEMIYQPPSILKTKYINLLGATVLEDGGHFLALELPQIFVNDVFKAVKIFKNWHNQNKNTEL